MTKQDFYPFATALLLCFLAVPHQATAAGLDMSNPDEKQLCAQLMVLTGSIAKEAEQLQVSAFQTDAFRQLNADRSSPLNALPQLVNELLPNMKARVVQAYSYYGLCVGVSNAKLISVAPKIARSCNNAPSGKELACIQRVLDTNWSKLSSSQRAAAMEMAR